MNRFRSFLCRLGFHRPQDRWFNGYQEMPDGRTLFGRFWTCHCTRSSRFSRSGRPSPSPRTPLGPSDVMAVHATYKRQIERLVGAFRAPRAGTAVTAPPALMATAPAVSAPPPDPLYVEESGVADLSPFAVVTAWSESAFATGARVRTDSWTSTARRLAGSPRSREVS